MKRDRRMVARSISNSKKVNNLDGEGALLYTWLILHLDDENRMEADPETVKAEVFPRRNHMPVETIKECLLEMDRLNLILYYQEKLGDKIYLELLNNKQTYHAVTKAKSSIPKFNKDLHFRLTETPVQVGSNSLDTDEDHHNLTKPHQPITNPSPSSTEPHQTPDATGDLSLREVKDKDKREDDPPYPPLIRSSQAKGETSQPLSPIRGRLPIFIQEQTTDEMWDIYVHAWQTFTIKPLVWNTMKIGMLKERLRNFSPDQIKVAISNLAMDRASSERGFAKFDWLIKSDENIETWTQYNSEQAKKETEKAETNISELAREIDERLVPGCFDRHNQMLYTLEGKIKQLSDRGFGNPEVQAHMIDSVGFQEICDSTGNVFFALLGAGKNYLRSRDRGAEDSESKKISREEAKEIMGNISNLTKGQ